jgi:hypothetical protein
MIFLIPSRKVHPRGAIINQIINIVRLLASFVSRNRRGGAVEEAKSKEHGAWSIKKDRGNTNQFCALCAMLHARS